MIVFLASDGVGDGIVGFDIVTLDFFQDLVGAAGLLVFDVENGIDEVLALEKAEAVLPAEAGEDGAVAESGLAVEVELGGPPGGRAVFELGPEGVKVVAAALGAEGGEVLDFEAARLLEIVVVGDDVRTLLRRRGRDESGRRGEGQSEMPRVAYKNESNRLIVFMDGWMDGEAFSVVATRVASGIIL